MLQKIYANKSKKKKKEEEELNTKQVKGRK